MTIDTLLYIQLLMYPKYNGFLVFFQYKMQHGTENSHFGSNIEKGHLKGVECKG